MFDSGSFARRFWPLLCWPLLCAPLHAAAPGTAPGAVSAALAEPTNLFKNGTFEGGIGEWFLKNPDRCEVSNTTIADPALQVPFTRALRVDVTPQAADKPWSVVLRQSVNAALAQNQKLVFRVWARSPESVSVTAFVEAAKPPYAKALSAEWKLTPDWKEYELAGACPQNFAAGEANCGLFVAHGKASIRLANARFFCVDKTTKLPPLLAATPTATRPPGSTGGGSGTPTTRPTTVAPPVAPGAPEELLSNGNFEKGLDGWQQFNVQPTPLEVKVGPYTRALSVQIAPQDEGQRLPPSMQNLTQAIASDLMTNDGLSFKVLLRSKERCPVTLRLDSPTQRRLIASRTEILSGEWREYEVRGRVPAPFVKGEARCQLWLGQQGGTIEIAGARLTRTTNVPADWVTPPKVFNRENLLHNGDFTDNAPQINMSPNGPVQPIGRWIVGKNVTCQSEIVAAQAGPYKSALRLNMTQAERTPFYPLVDQQVDTPPLSELDTLVLRFWARSPESCRMSATHNRSYRAQNEANNTFTIKTVNANGQGLVLTPEWKEYEIPLPEKPFPPDAPQFTTQAQVRFIMPVQTGTIEITGVRLAVIMAAP